MPEWAQDTRWDDYPYIRILFIEILVAKRTGARLRAIGMRYRVLALDPNSQCLSFARLAQDSANRK
jgi:hypothetical protein